MTKRIAVLAFILLCFGGAAMADQAASTDEKTLSVFTYQFKHKLAEKAATAIKTLVSAEGTVAIQSAANSVVMSRRCLRRCRRRALRASRRSSGR